jgi:hypothetical protein
MKNNDKKKCDIDGARLGFSLGDQIYCDKEHCPNAAKS